jgi:hypothetical protein
MNGHIAQATHRHPQSHMDYQESCNDNHKPGSLASILVSLSAYNKLILRFLAWDHGFMGQ